MEAVKNYNKSQSKITIKATELRAISDMQNKYLELLTECQE